MADSIRERIIKKVVEVLGAEGSPAKAVYRNRLDQLTDDDLPCYDVRYAGESTEHSDRDSVTHTMTVDVECIVSDTRSPDAENAVSIESACDPLIEFAQSVIDPMEGNSSTDPAVPGLWHVHMTGLQFQTRKTDMERAGALMSYEFTFETLEADETVAG